MAAPKGNQNAKGNKGNRDNPNVVKYTPEFIELAKEYLENYETEYEHAIPSIAGLAVISDISRECLRLWGKDETKVEFVAILAKLLAKQENVLISKGLKGEFNSNITKLALGKHGYHEKTDSTVSGPDGGPIQTEEVTRPKLYFF